jgi:large subunit ribosomal protein L6
MSRIGKKLITIPKGVEVKVNSGKVTVKGPKGLLHQDVHASMDVVVEGPVVKVVPKSDAWEFRKFQGLTRSLLNNMVVGVSEGFTKNLTLVGVGFRAAVQGSDLQLTLGYSHPIVFKIPKGLEIKVDKLTALMVTGADKQLVGQAAADIRSFRRPEPYHGKGVRYADEKIVVKAGKSSGKK